MGAARELTLGALALLAAGCAPVGEGVGVSSQAIRPDQTGIAPPAFLPGERVETFASPGGTFLLHFTREGRNAVPALDADSDGTPDYVAETASVYDAVLAYYRDRRGFRAPPSDLAVTGGNGGDGRFDVYLVDFAGVGDGAFRQEACSSASAVSCPGYMLQENDFAGYSYPSTRVATTILASHEFFHAVQAGYDVRRGPILGEATAVWATEQYDPSLNDFEGFTRGYLTRPDRSLDQVQTGPVDAFTYGASLWFQFLTERHDAEVVRKLWTACAEDDGATGWLDLLDGVLQRDYRSSFAAEYAEFTLWNLYTGTRANPTRSYDHGSAYPTVTTMPATLPHQENRVRLFHAATRYYRAALDGRTSVTAALVPPSDGGSDALEGLQVRVAMVRGSTVDEPRPVMNLTAGTETFDAAGASAVIFLVTSVRTAGPSRTPGICFGTVEEVAQCRGSVSGDAGVTDAGAGDATADTGAGASAGGESGGCAVSPRGSASPPVGAWCALALAGALARRRRVTGARPRAAAR